MRMVEQNETVELAPMPHIVGDSTLMRELLETVVLIAPQDITVLVRGETGTGKELIASLLHASSGRSAAPMVIFNCAAIPRRIHRRRSGTPGFLLPRRWRNAGAR